MDGPGWLHRPDDGRKGDGEMRTREILARMICPDIDHAIRDAKLSKAQAETDLENARTELLDVKEKLNELQREKASGAWMKMQSNAELVKLMNEKDVKLNALNAEMERLKVRNEALEEERKARVRKDVEQEP